METILIRLYNLTFIEYCIGIIFYLMVGWVLLLFAKVKRWMIQGDAMGFFSTIYIIGSIAWPFFIFLGAVGLTVYFLLVTNSKVAKKLLSWKERKNQSYSYLESPYRIKPRERKIE